MCSILHGRLVVPFMLTRKIFASKLDMWIRREYPTRTRGGGFQLDALSDRGYTYIFIEDLISSKGIHIYGTFTFTCYSFSLFLTLRNKFHEGYFGNL